MATRHAPAGSESRDQASVRAATIAAVVAATVSATSFMLYCLVHPWRRPNAAFTRIHVAGIYANEQVGAANDDVTCCLSDALLQRVGRATTGVAYIDITSHGSQPDIWELSYETRECMMGICSLCPGAYGYRQSKRWKLFRQSMSKLVRFL